jgi:hypothetical protein
MRRFVEGIGVGTFAFWTDDELLRSHAQPNLTTHTGDHVVEVAVLNAVEQEDPAVAEPAQL